MEAGQAPAASVMVSGVVDETLPAGALSVTVGDWAVGRFCPLYCRKATAALGPAPEYSKFSKQNGRPASINACWGGQVAAASPLVLKLAATVLAPVRVLVDGGALVVAPVHEPPLKPAVPVSTSASPLPTLPVQLNCGALMMVRSIPPPASVGLQPVKIFSPAVMLVRRVP